MQIFSVYVYIYIKRKVRVRNNARIRQKSPWSVTMAFQRADVYIPKPQQPNGRHTNSAECPGHRGFQHSARCPFSSSSSPLSLAMCSDLEVFIAWLFTIFVQKKQTEDNETEPSSLTPFHQFAAADSALPSDNDVHLSSSPRALHSSLNPSS